MSACAFGIGGRRRMLAKVVTKRTSANSAERNEAGFRVEKNIEEKMRRIMMLLWYHEIRVLLSKWWA